MSDADARRRIREDFEATLWVEAAAGTGKTSELVRRIVGLVAAGRARMSGVAAVTFTEKASGELKLRLRHELERARLAHDVPADVAARLAVAVRELETARVGTIHALCADLLRERPIEAGVDPRFEMAADDETTRLFDAAFDPWLQRTLVDPPEGVRRLLRRPPDADGRGPRLQLRKAGLELAERRDFVGAWTRPPFSREAALDRAVDAIALWATYGHRASRTNDNLAQASRVAAHWHDELRRRERVRDRDYDGIEVGLRAQIREWDWSRKGYGDTFGDGLTRAEVLEARATTRRLLAEVAEACDTDLAACLQGELASLVDAYDAAKQRSGKLDYVDLLLLVRGLLVRDATVRRLLQRRFTHLFVDEFQDTDPLQADILVLLAAADPDCADPTTATVAAGKLFVVGDPKQAIYRFRRADVACYEALKARLVAQGAALLHLSTSFRADPRIQLAINAAFEPRMCGEGQASYVALEPHRQAMLERPAVIALPVPHPYGRSGTTVERILASAPEAIANLIAWIVHDSDWRVTEADRSEPVPVTSRHICLLFRSTVRGYSDLMGLYTRPLEARGIPHVLVGGRGFHDRDEVLALRNALSAVEWPDDALSVYATLKGPLFALPDDALLLWRERFGALNPLHLPDVDSADPGAADLVQVTEALAVLGAARRGRNRRPIAGTIVQLLHATRAHAGFAAATSGEQTLANVLRVAQLARRFEATGPSSFRAFVDWLDSEAERGESPDAPVVEEGTDGVRLMTVHKSKGLEFPIVVLADLTTPAARDQPSRYIDPSRRLWAMPLAGCTPADLRDHAAEVLDDDRREAERIAYVAATRARDVLVMPAVGDVPRAGWFEALHPAIYPHRGTRRHPVAAPGCPTFGPDTLPDHDAAGDEGAVVPGQHRPEVGDHEVVWWDALERRVPWRGGLARTTMLEAADGVDDGREAFAAWDAARAETLAEGARPTIVVVVASDYRGRRTSVAVERTDADRAGRAVGSRFGSLVHAVMADVPFDADTSAITAQVAMHGRILGAPAPERRHAVAAVEAALRHPVLRRAAASRDCRREVAVAWHDGAVLVEGIADLVFADGDGWLVVDYKTDDDLRGRLAAYESQVAAYVGAVATATGEPARGLLLCL